MTVLSGHMPSQSLAAGPDWARSVSGAHQRRCGSSYGTESVRVRAGPVTLEWNRLWVRTILVPVHGARLGVLLMELFSAGRGFLRRYGGVAERMGNGASGT